LLAAFRETVRAYSIPSAYFDDLRAGMQMDIEKSRYATFPELRTYCYRVAGVVGLIMLRIFGCSDKKAEQFAEDLGIALQLTNIIRDIQEDFIRGRIYLPQDEMEQHNVTERHIETGKVDSAWQDFLKFQIRRARHYYATAAGGTRLIRDRRSRLVVLAISKMYGGILDEIERATYNVFFQRAHVNSVKKVFIALKIIISGEYA
jgi:phytoene synthase